MTCLNCDKPTSGRYCSNLCEDMDRHPAPVDDQEKFTRRDPFHHLDGKGACMNLEHDGLHCRPREWPNGHIIVLEGDGLPTKLGRCDCGGMSAANPSHRLGPITDSLRAGRILAGRNRKVGS